MARYTCTFYWYCVLGVSLYSFILSTTANDLPGMSVFIYTSIFIMKQLTTQTCNRWLAVRMHGNPRER